jgi:hypothetical protein
MPAWEEPCGGVREPLGPRVDAYGFAGCLPGYQVAGMATADGRTAEMAQCEVCGNDYDKAFQVTVAGATHTFDSFECAIHAVAPTCEHCGCRIIGHGVEADGRMFCCANCARKAGLDRVADRI